jgi:hypothetical protein
MSAEKSDDLTGNRTRDLLACSMVPQPVALPRAPNGGYRIENLEKRLRKCYKDSELYPATSNVKAHIEMAG